MKSNTRWTQHFVKGKAGQNLWWSQRITFTSGSQKMAEPPTSDEPNITYSLSTSRYGNIVCYNQTNEALVGDYSGWQSAKSIETALPFFVMQLLISNLSYGLMYSLTRPLHLPPFVAQILVSNQMSQTNFN